MAGEIKELTPQDRSYYNCEDVVSIMGVSRSKAYNMIRAMRKEAISAKLISPCYPAGKIPKRYFDAHAMM